MNIKQLLFAFMASLLFSVGAAAGQYTYSTPAVQGYDVVSYHAGKRPVRGNGNFVATHQGATYQFSSKENLETFKRSPDKYVPAYGGYCAFGVSVGKKFIGDPEVWRIVDGTLYLNLDAGIQDLWFKDVPGRIKSANAEWKNIKDKSPSSL
ncbi:YHS domain-containing (seleno)protein [Pseudoteredinibacter isoporae]|uniref:YHS domain-containing protein n=1 Tax=Pseudoteredinibacter isoporae TaxID=570281 RepID=A0A7X0MZD4_9GAMM|nr:YHS domain-containing (seleno)protein [Pseudoteredinibacter isoporae]MBB6523022.1 YHS domain-containing protein [Pseudoteredinibacter isoporae]NHO88544.1 YHS domain protein [Pseudoteredinibacter isoporae]NIB22765.1 YHS domain protein [Pseudoteredinibacter isoporae]